MIKLKTPNRVIKDNVIYEVASTKTHKHVCEVCKFTGICDNLPYLLCKKFNMNYTQYFKIHDT